MKCLIVRPPFAEYIVNGTKSVEYRKRKTNVRGRIGIIEAGTSKVIGDVYLYDCNYNPDIYLWEWCFASYRKFLEPITIQRKKGAIVWEEISDIPYNGVVAVPCLSPFDFIIEEKECHKLEQEFIQKYVRS